MALEDGLMRRYLVLKIAAAGLALSLLLHLASFADYEFGDKLHIFLNVLGIGLAVVWVANIPAWNRLGAGLSTLGRRTLQFASAEVRSLWFVCCGYMFFTALTQAKYDYVLQHTSPVPMRELHGSLFRVFTAAFICGYFDVVVVQYTAVKRTKERDGVV